MFPLCHIYLCDMVLNSSNDFALLGSIYPDAVISGKLGRDITHYNTGCLYNYFSDKDKDMRSFALGAVTHGVDMKGLDYFSDENYPGTEKGYCFYKAKAVEQDVVRCCSIPEEWGLWKAHNFIEMAFEIYLNNKDSSIKYRFKNALENLELVDYISSGLSQYYGMDSDYFSEGFRRFTGFFEYERMNEITMAQRYSRQLNIKHGIDKYDLYGASSIISQCVDIISSDIDSFFGYTICEIRKVIKNLQ